MKFKWIPNICCEPNSTRTFRLTFRHLCQCVERMTLRLTSFEMCVSKWLSDHQWNCWIKTKQTTTVLPQKHKTYEVVSKQQTAIWMKQNCVWHLGVNLMFHQCFCHTSMQCDRDHKEDQNHIFWYAVLIEVTLKLMWNFMTLNKIATNVVKSNCTTKHHELKFAKFGPRIATVVPFKQKWKMVIS